MAALAFGPIHNITTKSLSVVAPGDIEPGMLTKILLKIKQLLRLDKRKPAREEKPDANKEEDEASTLITKKETSDWLRN